MNIQQIPNKRIFNKQLFQYIASILIIYCYNMQKYEVVLLLDAKLSDTERQSVLGGIEKTLGTAIKEKDDIGLQALAYDLWERRGEDKAYIISYCVEAIPEDVLSFKKDLVYNKAIKRYVIYKMNTTEPFFMFEPVQKELTTIIDWRDQKKLGQKLMFYADKKNAKYLNRKALPMLKKYISRFGNIKPRKYTNNPVSLQKKLRETILRAREIGLIEYIKK